MKNSSTRDWLIDSVIIFGFAAAAAFLLPMVAAFFGAMFLHLYLHGTLFWVQWVTLQWLPGIIVGGLLGLAAGWFIRHRRLSIACLPAVLVSMFYCVYFCFVLPPFSWRWLWVALVIFISWLLLIAASLLCARFILQRRQPNTALEPTATTP